MKKIMDKPIVWLKNEVKTPPFSKDAMIEAGLLLRQLQKGKNISLPQWRPMPLIGKNCNELRITDQNKIWRIVYCIDTDAIIILHVFQKQTQKTPKEIIETCKKRIKLYETLDK